MHRTWILSLISLIYEPLKKTSSKLDEISTINPQRKRQMKGEPTLAFTTIDTTLAKWSKRTTDKNNALGKYNFAHFDSYSHTPRTHLVYTAMKFVKIQFDTIMENKWNKYKLRTSNDIKSLNAHFISLMTF